jgi:hypothetical protein
MVAIGAATTRPAMVRCRFTGLEAAILVSPAGGVGVGT